MSGFAGRKNAKKGKKESNWKTRTKTKQLADEANTNRGAVAGKTATNKQNRTRRKKCQRVAKNFFFFFLPSLFFFLVPSPSNAAWTKINWRATTRRQQRGFSGEFLFSSFFFFSLLLLFTVCSLLRHAFSFFLSAHTNASGHFKQPSERL